MNGIMDNRQIYTECYRMPNYRMGNARMQRVAKAVRNELTLDSTLLDVGCGRGELLDQFASWCRLVHGKEIVPDLCGKFVTANGSYRVDQIESLTNLQDDRMWDVVVCSDVMEHIQPEETEAAIQELWRVTKGVMLIHVAWFSDCRRLHGEMVELHINQRTMFDWLDLFKNHTTGSVEILTREDLGKQAFFAVRRNDDFHKSVSGSIR